ncbi:MAG: hypothetical protein ACFFAN_10175 [Promethearchaeota archaeon]
MSNIPKNILEKVPKVCELCSGKRIEYWDQTQEQIIFRCIDCGIYYPIPTDKSNFQVNFPL